jgi:hypothetical protein
LNTEEYERRMNVLIEESPYERVTNNPLDNMVNKAKDGIHGAIHDLNLSTYFQYALKISNPKVTQMYGIPKITRREKATNYERNQQLFPEIIKAMPPVMVL